MFLHIPDVHRPSHNPKCIIRIQVRNWLTLIEFNYIPLYTKFSKVVAKHAWMFTFYVLKNQYAHYCSLWIDTFKQRQKRECPMYSVFRIILPVLNIVHQSSQSLSLACILIHHREDRTYLHKHHGNHCDGLQVCRRSVRQPS